MAQRMTLAQIAQQVADDEFVTDGQGNRWEAQALREAYADFLANGENGTDWEAKDYYIDWE